MTAKVTKNEVLDHLAQDGWGFASQYGWMWDGTQDVIEQCGAYEYFRDYLTRIIEVDPYEEYGFSAQGYRRTHAPKHARILAEQYEELMALDN